MSTTTPAPNNTTSNATQPTFSSNAVDPSFEGHEDDYGYRSVSRAAVLCSVFALMGLLSWYSPLLLVLPAVALFFGLIAFGNLKRYPTELSGRPVAVAGFLMALLTLAICPVKHAYIYYTELPEGYERISFAALKSPVGAPDIPPMSAMELDGKMVFVKGYIHPRPGLGDMLLRSAAATHPHDRSEIDRGPVRIQEPTAAFSGWKTFGSTLPQAHRWPPRRLLRT